MLDVWTRFQSLHLMCVKTDSVTFKCLFMIVSQSRCLTWILYNINGHWCQNWRSLAISLAAATDVSRTNSFRTLYYTHQYTLYYSTVQLQYSRDHKQHLQVSSALPHQPIIILTTLQLMFVNTAGTESSQFSTLNYIYCFSCMNTFTITIKRN